MKTFALFILHYNCASVRLKLYANAFKAVMQAHNFTKKICELIRLRNVIKEQIGELDLGQHVIVIIAQCRINMIGGFVYGVVTSTASYQLL